MSTVLVLTHTDIHSDNRILKEMEALASAPLGLRIIGIGVAGDEGAAPSSLPPGVEVKTIPVLTRRLALLPRALRYPLVMLELFLRMTILGLRTGASVVHCHDTMVLPIALALATVLRARLVYDAHELESDKNGGTLLLSRATLFIERLAWRRVDLFITVSPSIVQWYHRTFTSKPSVVVLNSPAIGEEPVGSQGGGYFHTTFGIPEDDLVFLYVGLLGPGRGLEQLAEVFSSGRVHSHLVLVGYGDLQESLRRKSQTSPQVHVHDPVPHAQVVSLVRNADVGLCLIENVSLSDYYCLPNKLFEYAFAGIPVIASDFPELRRVVEEHRLGRCIALERDAIVSAISECETDPLPPPAASVVELGWDRQASVLVNAYHDLLQGTRLL